MRTLRYFILIIAVLSPRWLFAQSSPLPVSSVVAASTGAEPDARPVQLLVGRSTVLDTNMPIARVSLTSADVADAMVTGPSQLLINGKLPGTISMFVWDRSGGIRRYEVVVQRDLARLADQVKQLFPGESIEVASNGKSVVLSGLVSNKDVIEHAVSVASGYVEKKDDVVTLLQVRAGGASNQVLLRVRFAEVSRTAMTDLGASFFTGANGYKDYVGRATTQQYPAPDFDQKNGLVFSDFLNLFLFNTKQNIGVLIKALQTKGLFQSLAEPNLVAESGKEASFLAGGEIPVPVAQGTGAGTSISVTYKEFGVRLNFTPVVTGNRIHLKVRPEVSTLDFSNAVVLNGFKIPALNTRRTETELELENGQTFAIAGLMNNSVNSELRKVPGIGDIPILGTLFKSKGASKTQTELVVMITPEILPNNSVGVTDKLPLTPERYITPLPNNKLYQEPPPAFEQGGASRSDDGSAPRPSVKGKVSSNEAPAAVPVAEAQAPAPDPKAAAATVAALNPQKTRQVINGDAKPAAAPAQTASASAGPAAQAAGAQGPVAQASATPATNVSRPTADEKKTLERAHKQEELAKAQAATAAAKQMAADREKQKKEADAQAKNDRAQAQKDAEAARVAEKEAQHQAELDAKRQKAVDIANGKRQKLVEEAQAKVKAAEAEYQAEVQKNQKQ